MDQKAKNFIYSIVVPTILAITMFVVSFYVILIPMFEQSMMDRKKETIHELTNAAWSVLVEYNEAHKKGTLNLEEAKQRAAEHVGKMRYGEEQKDYFWIISSHPKMIMHPYRPDLNGTDLGNYTDNHENRLFADAAQLVKTQGEGMIQYYWQWKDDASKVVPKLSYVKGFEEWDWIVGTGIYIEDVQQEIKQLKTNLLKISAIITLIIIVILIYVLRQTRKIENERQEAERQLRISMARYKSLVDASTEGTLMVVDGKVVFSNLRFITLLRDTDTVVVGMNFSELFKMEWTELSDKISNSKKTYTLETELLLAKSGLQNVVISTTRVQYSGQTGYIVMVKNVTEKSRMRLDAQKLTEDVQLSLQLMNQPVKHLVNPNVLCELNRTVKEAATLMSDKQTDLLCISSNGDIIGVITDKDLRNRVLAKGNSEDKPVASIMTSPVIGINQDALLFEAILKFKLNNISHLLVENNYGQTVGNINHLQCLEMQRNSLAYLIQEINQCTVIEELKRIYNRVPLLIQAVFTSTDNINSVSRIITSIADAISRRIIELVLREVGEAPCEFAFIAMGSEGRGEQTLRTDQDNALIFAEDTEANKNYFLNFSELINEYLHAIGYSRCKGDLMAGNPEWCNAIGVWKGYFSDWVNNHDLAKVLDSSIFFDLRLIYGNQQLVDDLWKHIYDELNGNSVFFNLLAKTVTRQRPTIGKKNVDIKQFLVPIIGYLRIYALRNSVNETNSLLRLKQLIALDVISEMKAEEIEKMYNYLMHLRIKWQVELILDNDIPDNKIILRHLTALDQETLKNIIREVSKLQDNLKAVFKVSE